MLSDKGHVVKEIIVIVLADLAFKFHQFDCKTDQRVRWTIQGNLLNPPQDFHIYPSVAKIPSPTGGCCKRVQHPPAGEGWDEGI